MSNIDVVCKLRKVVIPTKSGNEWMINLFYHLSRSHPFEYSGVKQPLETLISKYIFQPYRPALGSVIFMLPHLAIDREQIFIYMKIF